jgi:hypothetical protein
MFASVVKQGLRETLKSNALVDIAKFFNLNERVLGKELSKQCLESTREPHLVVINGNLGL